MKLPVSLLDRYLGSEFIKAFALSLFGLVLMFQIVTILEIMRMESGSDKSDVYNYLLYSLPQIIVFVIPAALMFGVCFTVAQFTVSRELVAIHSAGISFYRAIVPILLTGIVLSFFIFIFQNYVVTKSNRAAAAAMAALQSDQLVVRDMVWQRNLRGRGGYYFIYFLDRSEQRIIGGFNYLEMLSSTVPSRMVQAREARYLPDEGRWRLIEVEEILFDEELRIVEVRPHFEMVIEFADSYDFFLHADEDPSSLSIAELSAEIERRHEMGYATIPYEVQRHASFAFPFMSLIVVVMGSIAGAMGSHRGGGPLIRSLLWSTATIFFFQLTFRLGESLGRSGVTTPAVAGWGPTVMFAAISFILILRNRK